MKLALSLVVTFFLFGAQSSYAQQPLHDQTISTVGTAVASQHFESTNSTYDCMAADDFTIPSGEQWHIDSIVARGHYVVPTGQPLPGAGIIVHIYEDGGGYPDSLIYSDTNLMNVDLNFNGILVARFSSPLILDPGQYWVGISARKDAGSTSTQWEWFNSSSNLGDTAHWANPGNGFALGCTSYAKLSACLANFFPGMSFSVHGCPLAPPEIIGLASSATICTNEPLTVMVSTNVSIPVWSWSSGESGDSIVVNQTGQHVVSCKDSLTECVTMDTINVFAIEAPGFEILDDTVCDGDTLTMMVQTCSGCTYAWSSGSSTSSAQIISGGLVSVTVTEGIFGCNESDSAQVDLIIVDSVEFGVDYPLVLCEGDSLVVPLNSTYESYQWSTGSTTNEIWASEAGTYTVTVSIGECTEQGELDVFAAPNPNPNIGYMEDGGLDVLYADSGFVFYQWSTGSATQSIIVDLSAAYSITVTDSNGCEGSALFEYTVGIPDLDDNFKHYPIPVTQTLTVELNNSFVEEIMIFSLSGKLERSVDAKGRTLQIDLSDLIPGQYILSYKLYNGNAKQFVIDKL
ncbi:MAG: T9SS type A sorting domain-containing protein [Flavobacteriales bacterium]|jgi:hypothetical protein|nr:T9SS type A sorting domain-containing protein [Flavobacteriales bacterium]NCG30489.1 T9SS type A sorting domain-containing protein [Bacteroidota bacterium]MBT3964172.1 T9SS type A sorting domain-containing protein [Flavobacteriales bacterium]MBT4706094.1 T9SS type A sorting domain-containing protein [Flavobacteriales bacterium]MBT4930659.1 T9SS type A sorting domain-containing protein [Flavobacteriales bacterium]